MKTRYSIIIIIMIIAVFAIVYNASQWLYISKSVKMFINIENISYKLEIANEKQKVLLNSLEIENNYDAIVKNTKTLYAISKRLEDAILDSGESNLMELLESIANKKKELKFIYEDIKTDNAEIKNSLKWLSSFYSEHLDKTNPSDVRLLQYIFNILDISRNDEIIDMEPFKFKTQNPSLDILRIHLRTLFYESEKFILLKSELETNDISIDTSKINIYLDNKLDKIRENAKGIVATLLISVVFLIFFGLLVYIREIRVTLRVAGLKNELERFVDALNESAIVSKTDLDGNITYVNKKFCQTSGYSQDELIGKNHNIIRHPDTPSSVFKELWSTIESKKPFKVTMKNLRKDGAYYYVDSVVLPMIDINNELVEYLAVRYEVTELIDARDNAIMAEKAKGEFLSNMSHELRTPLNAINGFSTILKREIKDEKHISYIQNILDSSDNLIGLIGDILDLSKLQSGKFTLDYHDFNLQEKMKRFLTRFDAQLELLNLKIKTDLDGSTNATFSGDWLRISQIITNLISNALKFSHEGGEIFIGCRYDDGNLKLVVSDNGIGMSKEAQDKIFKPFEQADTSITRKYGGTGLGLSIVLNLVEQMDGEIELDSKEGEGSRFSVIIPLIEIKNLDNKQIDELSTDEKKELYGHILIAEDNKTNQMLISILVEEFGLSYKMANDGVEAISMFGKEKFDLVLMDENMPNMNGTEAAKEIHTLYGNDVPIVALTANVMSGDKEKFLKAGMDAYVAKPIDESELYRVLKSFLDKNA